MKLKLNWAVFKKGKPIYWVAGGIAIFVFFYYIYSKGSSGSSGSTVVSSGPSDAQVAANTQGYIASLQAQTSANNLATQANAAVAVAQLQANTTVAQYQASADVAKYTAGLDAQTAAATLTTQQNIASINAQYGLDTAKVAAETVLGQAGIQSATLLGQSQIASNTLISQQQTQAAEYHDLVTATTQQALIGQIANVQSQDRDQLVAAIGSQISGVPTSYVDAGNSNISVYTGTKH